jgi:hypothetical protein
MGAPTRQRDEFPNSPIDRAASALLEREVAAAGIPARPCLKYHATRHLGTSP